MVSVVMPNEWQIKGKCFQEWLKLELLSSYYRLVWLRGKTYHL
jgi:hypothetical protein